VNDESRLEVERFFDDELPEAARRRLLDRLETDPAARRHLDHLAGLRDLARRHDPASLPPIRDRAPRAPR
jgi:anti-sigma factor RsiW